MTTENNKLLFIIQKSSLIKDNHYLEEQHIVSRKCPPYLTGNIIPFSTQGGNFEHTIFRDVTLCSVADRYRQFRGTSTSISLEKSGDSVFLQKVSNDLPDYTVYHPKRHYLQNINQFTTSHLSTQDITNDSSDIRMKRSYLARSPWHFRHMYFF
jgi:hypothetical protein